MFIFGYMKKALAILLMMCAGVRLMAQNSDLQLARQYSTNGENQKAADIYQKLYKQSNEDYFPFYLQSLIKLKKYDEAESVVKKIMKAHPHDYQYIVALGSVYH